MSPKDDLQTLGLGLKANAAEIKARHRELALEHHPDHGGDATTFRAVNEAYQRLKDRKCLACKGVGYVEKQRGFSSQRVKCDACKGTGK